MTVNDLSNGLAQVINTSGDVAGAAFFIDHEVAVTCAHVVLHAMRQKDNAKPEKSIRLKLSSNGKVTEAYIIHSGWYSPDKEDIAFLKIKDPQENVTALKLGNSSLPGSDFRALGFPDGFNSGLFATGKIVGKVPRSDTNIDWLQISSNQITKGFSGSPLWSEESSSVLGMIQAFLQDSKDTAFAVSAETLKLLYPSKDNIIERITKAEKYSDYQQKNQALVDLIPRMSDFESVEYVISLVEKIDEPIYQIDALVNIAELADLKFKSKVALNALTIVRKLNDEKTFADNLNKIIPYLPKEDLQDLSSDILKIKTETLKVSVLKKFLAYIPDGSFTLAISLVRIIDSPEERASLLLDIAPKLPEIVRQDAFIEAMNAARSVIDPLHQAQLLQQIIPYLPKDFQEREALIRQDAKVINDQQYSYSEQIKIISRAIDDRPSEIDLLGFSAYSSALADFIRDKNTLKPLTIGIDASWGMGKTTLMNMIRKELLNKPTENVSHTNNKNKSNFPVVWFNAWKYDKENSLWAAFALDVLKQAKGQLNLRQRLFLSIKLGYKRLDRELILKTLSKLAVTAIVIYGFGAILYGIIGLLVGFHFLIQYVTAIGALGFLTALYSSGKELLDRLGTLDVKLSKYVREPNYREKIGFLADFEEDFKGLISIVTQDGKCPLVIFIDDLDRCSPPISKFNNNIIKLFVRDEEKSTVELSRFYIELALNNIISNAVKYSLKGIPGKPRVIEIKSEATENFYKLSISNIGVGLLPEEFEKIFYDGYKGINAANEYRSGVGRGLFVAKEIITHHHGEIIVSSKEVREGYLTTFTVLLPYNQSTSGKYV
jgi:signal transduction histidine kinase